MNKRMYAAVTCFFLYSSSPALASAPSLPMLEDAFFSVLFPQINAEIQKSYGEQKKYDCPEIVEMKKLYSGTYLFQSSIEVITYNQKPQGKPEPPFEKVRITFDNEQGEWEVKSTKLTRLPDSTSLTCRKPV